MSAKSWKWNINEDTKWTNAVTHNNQCRQTDPPGLVAKIAIWIKSYFKIIGCCIKSLRIRLKINVSSEPGTCCLQKNRKRTNSGPWSLVLTSSYWSTGCCWANKDTCYKKERQNRQIGQPRKYFEPMFVLIEGMDGALDHAKNGKQANA